MYNIKGHNQKNAHNNYIRKCLKMNNSFLILQRSLFFFLFLGVLMSCKLKQNQEGMSSVFADNQFGGGAIQLNSSINIYGQAELEDCSSLVKEAVNLENHSLSFTPTLWYPNDQKMASLMEVKYGVFHDKGKKGEYLEINSGLVQTIYAGYKACFTTAFKSGIRDVTILPHSDSVPSANRTTVNFDIIPNPQAMETDCSGMESGKLSNLDNKSYYDVLIRPISCALEQAVKDANLKGQAQVNFNLSGEMGATVYHNPEDYIVMIAAVKKLIPSAKLKIGLSYNWDFSLIEVNASGQKIETLKSLFKNLDFFGISAYTELYSLLGKNTQKAIIETFDCCKDESAMLKRISEFKFDWNEMSFEKNWDNFLNLKPYSKDPQIKSQDGMTPWDFIKDLNLELHYSEVGVGGGIKPLKTRAVKHWFWLFNYPYIGTEDCGFKYFYSQGDQRTMDSELEQDDVVMTNLKGYYSRVLKTLSTNTYSHSDADKNWKKFKVTRAYLWNTGSFDVQGLHRTGKSCVKKPILEMIRYHNKGIQSLQ